jgi:quercetin dioxygenase-like cupin family protein
LQEIRVGGFVVVSPKSRHWHGAAPEQMICHLAISEIDETGAGSEWLETILETDFNAVPQ